MKQDQLYQSLKELAEKIELSVCEHNLRSNVMRIKSGMCKVKGRNLYIMDKHLPISKKIELLAACLSQMPHEEVFVIPAVRELLDKFPKESK